MDREQLKLNLKARRESAIKNGRVFSSDKSESFFANEATDWTYQDFQDATQILINRLNQLLTVCDTDNPGPEQAKLMHKIGNMTRIYSDKMDRVFNQDLPVGDIQDAGLSDEQVLSEDVLNELANKLEYIYRVDPNQCKLKNEKSQLAISFYTKTKAGFDVRVLIDLYKIDSRLLCAITCSAKDNDSIKVDDDIQAMNRRDTRQLECEESAEAIIERLANVLAMYDERFGLPEFDYAYVGSRESKQAKYKLPIDVDVLNIL